MILAKDALYTVHGYASAAIECGGARVQLLRLPSNSIDAVVTSPPYYGLRVYRDLAPQVWGGEPGCLHEWGEERVVQQRGPVGGRSTLDGGSQRPESADGPQSIGTGAWCTRCGAWRGHLGNEPEVGMYVEHLVEVFAGVWRVLKPTGTLWVVMGDSYYSGNRGDYHLDPDRTMHSPKQQSNKGASAAGLQANRIRQPGLKDGDLMGAPWRFAFAMQAAGWWLVSDVIWRKPAPMPSSVNGWRWEQHRRKRCPACGGLDTIVRRVCRECGERDATRTAAQGYAGSQGGRDHPHGGVEAAPNPEWVDCPGCAKCEESDGLVLRKGRWRPTSSHEYIFCFAKTQQPYGDREAAREPLAPASVKRMSQETFDSQTGGPKGYGENGSGVNPNNSARRTLENLTRAYRSGDDDGTGRNPRDVWPSTMEDAAALWAEEPWDVWDVGPEPSRYAHYAAFPSKLAEKIIAPSTPEGGVCSACGRPWARVHERTGHVNQREPAHVPNNTPTKTDSTGWAPTSRASSEWRPVCSCNAPSTPATVLDPFAGTGTTLVSALRMGRSAIGIELSPAYAEMARERLSKDGST